MIRCDKGDLKIVGSKSLLKAELSTLIFSLKRNEVLTVDDINKAVKKALETTEGDVIKHASDEVRDKLKKILDILEED